MSQESEQAQEAWLRSFAGKLATPSEMYAAINTRDDYKAALKAEIEKRLAYAKEMYPAGVREEECRMFLSLLDTVTPIK